MPRRLTEREFIDPPWNTEKTVAETWDVLTPSLAARPEVWTRIHVELIEQGRIRSSYLAADANGDLGRNRIERALRGKDAQKVDDCVRSVLRRMGGVIRDRASRTAYIDCPLAKAWWRHRYALEVHRVWGDLTPREFSDALRPSFRWEVMIQHMVSKLTVIGDSAIRPAVVRCLAQGGGNTKQELENLLRLLGRRTTVQALGALGPDHVLQIVLEDLLPSSTGGLK